MATGEMLHNFSQGLDSTQLESVPDRKSIGVEVNWGIRFTDKAKAMRFFSFVCAELASRVDQVGMRALGHPCCIQFLDPSINFYTVYGIVEVW